MIILSVQLWVFFLSHKDVSIYELFKLLDTKGTTDEEKCIYL